MCVLKALSLVFEVWVESMERENKRHSIFSRVQTPTNCVKNMQYLEGLFYILIFHIFSFTNCILLRLIWEENFFLKYFFNVIFFFFLTWGKRIHTDTQTHAYAYRELSKNQNAHIHKRTINFFHVIKNFKSTLSRYSIILSTRLSTVWNRNDENENT